MVDTTVRSACYNVRIMSELEHGVLNTYRYHKCRCEECRAANAAYAREYRAKNPEAVREAHRRYHRKHPDRIRAYREKLKQSTDIPHGTGHGYRNYGCRCVECTAANAASAKRYRLENPEASRAAHQRYMKKLRKSDDIPHGTTHGYVNYRCRCDECRRANTEYRREYRARKKQQQKPAPLGVG